MVNFSKVILEAIDLFQKWQPKIRIFSIPIIEEQHFPLCTYLLESIEVFTKPFVAIRTRKPFLFLCLNTIEMIGSQSTFTNFANKA